MNNALQMHLLRNSPSVLAEKWREAEATARRQYPKDTERHAFYAAEAAKFEAIAKQDNPTTKGS